ncbi:MAG: DUF4097 family beta strand repeat-containing protein [Acidobacteriota bacterium]|nr:DUF4097 family beta strand repeat-containing protein [Acidobacteriota bacterium]
MRTTLIILLAGLLPAFAQDDPITFSYTRPDQPGKLIVRLNNGGIQVSGTDGDELIVNIDVPKSSAKPKDSKAEGLRHLASGTALEIVEEDNVAEIHVKSHETTTNLNIQVPRRTSLVLSTHRNGNIAVSDVTGDMELEAHAGDISVKNVSGSVLAHSLRGEITATLTGVTPGRAQSFSTLQGDVDVTLPPSVAAEFCMESQFGEVFTDFEIEMTGTRISGGKRDRNGRFQLGLEKALYANVNGGGPRFDFKSLKGNIYIRTLSSSGSKK